MAHVSQCCQHVIMTIECRPTCAICPRQVHLSQYWLPVASLVSGATDCVETDERIESISYWSWSCWSCGTYMGTWLVHIWDLKLDLNLLWPREAIWRQISGSTLVQVMACCLRAPSHYLNQCWLIISKVLWHSSEGNFIRDTSATIH